MTEKQVDLQLARIEELQASLRRVIVDESLSGLEELVEELGSRLSTLLAEPLAAAPGLRARERRLRAIADAQQELADLASAKSQSISQRLRQVRIGGRVSTKYTGEPVREQATLWSKTDRHC